MKTILIKVIISVLLLISCNSETNSVEFEVNEMNKKQEKEIFLTEEEEEDLLFLREEEKLARDVYLYSYQKYGTKIFGDIIKSEEKHMSSVLKLLKKYNIEDPALDIGLFVNNFLQEKYDELIAKSNSSYLNALIVGDYIEDLDIDDLTKKEESTTKEDLLKVYGSLKCGSRNHLRSFNYQVELNDGEYEPEFISTEEFESIVNSEHEKCK
jgi:hypothetical protein